jgi:putative NADPH-quinone reductase
MRVLVLFAHPLADSYQATLHRTAVEALRAAGHEVDDCDLYAEEFNPVLSAQERRHYHDLARNRQPVAAYVSRLMAAEALVLCFPTWCFGPPAILKGFFDRVLLPGVSFTLENGVAQPALTHIRHLAAVVTYGRPRYMAWWVGDPPRRIVTRYLYWLTGRRARLSYLAHYHMNVARQADCRRFIARVEATMRMLGRE